MNAVSSSALRATIGGNLATLRRARGISLGELARRAGVGKATLSELEAGKRNVTLETLHALTTALGVSLGAPLADLSEPVLAGTSARADLVARLEDPAGTTELYRLRLLANAAPHRATHAPGLEKIAIVHQGTLCVSTVGSERRTSSGESGRWAAEAPETYTVIGDRDVEATLLLRYDKP